MKAYLLCHEVEFPFTHNLGKLVKLASEKDEAFASLVSEVEPLTPYAVELRYDDAFWPSEDVAEEATALAASLMEFIVARLPGDVLPEEP